MRKENAPWKPGIFLLALLFLGIAFAGAEAETGDASDIAAGICELYNIVQIILGAVIFVLVVLAAVIYAAGQVMGAETRARASVWSTSMIVGAMIGIIIYVLVPPILDTMIDVDVDCASVASAGGGTGETGLGLESEGGDEGVVCGPGYICVDTGPSGECISCARIEVEPDIRPDIRPRPRIPI